MASEKTCLVFWSTILLCQPLEPVQGFFLGPKLFSENELKDIVIIINHVESMLENDELYFLKMAWWELLEGTPTKSMLF